MIPSLAPVRAYLLDLQQRIVRALGEFHALGGPPFVEERWDRPEGGDGVSILVEDGAWLERAGVNFSHVMGDRLPPAATAHRPQLVGKRYEVLGLSLVLHPVNPFVPTVHMNIRCFFAFSEKPDEPPAWWFGGGMDLTPAYGFDEDAKHFHAVNKATLDRFDARYYPQWKAQCDEYFYLKHRQEARGIGGIFFDDFNELGFEKSFALLRAVGDSFLVAYLPIAERRFAMPYDAQNKTWQYWRRGRYVEFNLVYDRGTLFGLQSNGRIESILMSLPLHAQWRKHPPFELREAELNLASRYLKPRDWLAE